MGAVRHVLHQALQRVQQKPGPHAAPGHAARERVRGAPLRLPHQQLRDRGTRLRRPLASAQAQSTPSHTLNPKAAGLVATPEQKGCGCSVKSCGCLLQNRQAGTDNPKDPASVQDTPTESRKAFTISLPCVRAFRLVHLWGCDAEMPCPKMRHLRAGQHDGRLKGGAELVLTGPVAQHVRCGTIHAGHPLLVVRHRCGPCACKRGSRCWSAMKCTAPGFSRPNLTPPRGGLGSGAKDWSLQHAYHLYCHLAHMHQQCCGTGTRINCLREQQRMEELDKQSTDRGYSSAWS